MTDDLKITQNKLIKTEKLAAAAQIVSEAAHEIRNPLMVISSGLYLLKRVIREENPIVTLDVQVFHHRNIETIEKSEYRNPKYET